MKNSTKQRRLFCYFILSILFYLILGTNVFGQDVMGISFNYETFPSVNLADPKTNAKDLKIQTDSWSMGAAFPLMFAEGKIMVLNKIQYKRVDFSYKNFLTGTKVNQAQSIKFTSFIIDSLSEKWSLIVVMTPGLASDFKGSLTMDDFTLEAVLGFVRKYSKTFQLGFGLAYVRDFGSPIPMPFIYIDWNISSNLKLSGLVPVDLALTYKLNPMVDFGLAMKVRGDRYHGDPDKFKPTKNPQMEYSEGTLSPFIKIHFLDWIHLNIEGGYAVYRNFEFLDGNESAESYDLEKTGYLRAGLVLGM